MNMKYFVSIDAGIHQVKTVLFDVAGHEIEDVSVEIDLLQDSIRAEVDMIKYWNKTAECVRLLLKKSQIDPDRVWAVSVTGQSGGLWALDAYGNPIGNAILNVDTRAEMYVKAIQEKTPGVARLIHRNLGTPITAGTTLVLLKWLKQNRMEIYSEIAHLFFAKDWIRYCLTGDISTEVTDAGSSFLKISDQQMVTQVLTILEIEEAQNWLPTIKEPSEIAAILNVPASEKTGLNAGTPVIVGATATAAASFGMGAIKEEDLTINLDTSCTISVVQKQKNCDYTHYHYHYLKHCVEDNVLNIKHCCNGMESIRFVAREIARTSNQQMIENMVNASDPGANGVVFHPYLALEGEVMPFTNENARASFFGISETTTKNDLLRAAYEGVAYAIKDCLGSSQNSNTILLSGEGIKSMALCQMIADVTGIRVVTSVGEEMPARGAAMLAGVGVGVYDSFETAVRKCCKINRMYQPHNLEVYDKTFVLYNELRLAYNHLWNRRIEILG